MRTSIVATLAPCFAEEQDPDPDTDPQTNPGSKNPESRREPVQPKPKDWR